MKVLVTGADGFIGKNLRIVLGEHGHEVLSVTRDTSDAVLAAAVAIADATVHLAGVNRPRDAAEFVTGNADFTAHLCDVLLAAARNIPVAFASSVQAERDNPYGASKRAAEGHLRRYAEASGATVGLYRLANVFGKWSRPNYNSAVATFCHNIARGLPVHVDDPAATVQLVYIDDVVIWGQSAAECLRNVRLVVTRLREKGLLCNGEKCCLLSKRIELLGHIISEGSVKP